jgi:hypothetical protein
LTGHVSAARLRRLVSGGAALLVAVVLLAALRELPRSFRTEHERIRPTEGLSSLQRELAPARLWHMNVRLLLRAQEILPRDAVYSVAVGRRQAVRGVTLFYGYWLLPRRRSIEPGRADWIVLWGKDPSSLRVKTDVVADLGGGAEILRVRR